MINMKLLELFWAGLRRAIVSAAKITVNWAECTGLEKGASTFVSAKLVYSRLLLTECKLTTDNWLSRGFGSWDNLSGYNRIACSSQHVQASKFSSFCSLEDLLNMQDFEFYCISKHPWCVKTDIKGSFYNIKVLVLLEALTSVHVCPSTMR